MVGFPYKPEEPHLSIGYTPRPQVIVPIEVRVWNKDSSGVDRNLKAMAVELYALVDDVEEIIRTYPRLDNPNVFIKVLPSSLSTPTLEQTENNQIIRVTINVSVDMRIL